MPPFTRLVLPDALRDELIAHARSDSPNECCGLLAGRIEGETATATTRYPLRNALGSPTEYETDARDMVAAFRHMRQTGLELLAVYHSHPTSEPVPSRRDVERNTYGETVVHLIVGATSGRALLDGTQPDGEPVVRAWWLAPTGYREADVSGPG